MNNGVIAGEPLANLAYSMSSVFDSSPTFVHVDGTSRTEPGLLITGNFTNTFYQALFQRHPEWTCRDYYSMAGSSFEQMTNLVTTAGQANIQGYTQLQFPYLDLTLLPTWHFTQRILFTDHPRNDNLLTPAQNLALFEQFYSPLKQAGVKIVFSGTGVDTLYWGMMTNVDFPMMNEPMIDQYLPEYKYAERGGIFDMGNGGLSSSSAHYNGTNQSWAWYCVKQWAGLYDGVQPIPYTTNNALAPQWPTYSVSLAASPSTWTNMYGTPCDFTVSGGTVTGVGVDGVSFPLPLTGGTVTLQPFEWISLTNSVLPTAVYRPHP